MSCEFSPFVILQCESYFVDKTNEDLKESPMNWIFETYSNVYNTAMMVEQRPVQAESKAKKPAASKLARLFGRG